MTLTPNQIAAIQRDQERVNAEQVEKGAREFCESRGDLRLLREARDAGITRDAAGTGWRHALARRGDRIIGDERNVLMAMRLAPELGGLVRFNEFALRVEFTRAPHWRQCAAGAAWTDDDDLALQAWFQGLEIDVRQRGVVADSVGAIAKESPCHPVREYLRSLRWDGDQRLDGWLRAYLGATEPENYLAAVGGCFMVSAVARIMEPGCQADHVLVLEGAQGIGKSKAARTLAIRSEWFADDLPDVHSKDAALQLSGKWIVELAELAAIRRSTEVEAVKAYLTRTQDVFRPPYGRRTVTVPRQSVFIATTNEREYLRDPTGNRRFWPVSCTRIDLVALGRDCNQLWAEAVYRYDAGHQWYLSDDEVKLAAEEQRGRLLVTELEADVADYLARLVRQGKSEVTVREVFIDALNLDPRDRSFVGSCRQLGREVAQAINRAGWQKVRATGRGVNRRTVYGCPAHRDS